MQLHNCKGHHFHYSLRAALWGTALPWSPQCSELLSLSRIPSRHDSLGTMSILNLYLSIPPRPQHTLQHTQKALRGFSPSQPLLPQSRKRSINCVYKSRWIWESRTRITFSSLAGRWIFSTVWPLLQRYRSELTRQCGQEVSVQENNRILHWCHISFLRTSTFTTAL